MLQALSIVDWKVCSGRPLIILKTTAFFPLAMHLWAFLNTEPKKRPVAAGLLAVLSLDEPICLADGDSFNDKTSIS